LVLVGLPASGKSTVGAAVATRLEIPFVDSDDLVIAADGRQISEIFLDDGERMFREREATAIAQALAQFEGVLALGGGAVTTAAVRAALSSAGAPVVLLTAGTDELLARVGDTGHRPLLSGDPRARLAELAAAREPLYREVATGTVDTAGRPVDQVADEIVVLLSGHVARDQPTAHQ
jgi:shikimate kinase